VGENRRKMKKKPGNICIRERWYYGHFHNSWHSEIGGVWYKMLDIMELLEVPRIKEEI